jgi:LL-diaminopimelate aminotransferase
MTALSAPDDESLPPVAERLKRLPPYGFAIISQRVGALTAAGHDVIRLDVGSPDMPPPDHVIEALRLSTANPDHHGYGSYQGHPAFRRAVADYYRGRFGIELDPDREVLPLIGSKEGLVNLTLAFVDRGDAVIAPDVNYPAYSLGATMAGGDVIRLRLDPARGYAPDLDALRTHPDLPRAKLLWVNYPNNPTGATVELETYQQLVAFCREYRLLLCSDNPYGEIVFDGYRAPSALQADPEKSVSVEFMSLSKTYNMAGWRLGACVGNRRAIEALLTVKSNIDSGHFRAIYDAGTAALAETPQGWIDARNAVYAARRDRIMSACPRFGLEPRHAKGSLYIWARVAGSGGDELAWTGRALQEAHVSITPGSLFGEAGAGFVRISVTVPDERLDDALRRLERWYAGL